MACKTYKAEIAKLRDDKAALLAALKLLYRVACDKTADQRQQSFAGSKARAAIAWVERK